MLAFAAFAPQRDAGDLTQAELLVRRWSAKVIGEDKRGTLRHPLRAAEQLDEHAERYRREAGPLKRHHRAGRPFGTKDDFATDTTIDEATRHRLAEYQIVEDHLHALQAAEGASALAAAVRFVFHNTQRRSASLLLAS